MSDIIAAERAELSGAVEKFDFAARGLSGEEALANKALETAQAITLADAETAELAAQITRAVAQKRDALDATRKEVSDPLYKAWKRNNELYAKPLSLLQQAIDVLKAKTGAFVVEQRRLELAAHAAAQQAYTSAAPTEQVIVATQQAFAAQTQAEGAIDALKASGVTVREEWVVDSVDLAQLPLEFHMVNMALLQKLAKGHKGDAPPTVGGVTFRKEARTTQRR